MAQQHKTTQTNPANFVSQADRSRLLAFAKKHRVKVSDYPTDFEADELRFSARMAYLDGRVARSRDLNAVAACMERFLSKKVSA